MAPKPPQLPLTALDGRCPSDPELAMLWRTLRAEFHRALIGHPELDPRMVLVLNGPEQLAAYRQQRNAFVAAHFANDARVETRRLP